MLTNEIVSRINCASDPFTDELKNVDDVLATAQHKFVLSKMVNAAQQQKFIGIHGGVGSGKSTMKILFLQKLRDEHNYIVSEPIITDRSKCHPGAIQDAMITDFTYLGWDMHFERSRTPNKLEDKSRRVYAILRNKLQDGKKCVLIIDEAHDLPRDTIKALKRFHEYQHGFQKMLSIILIGQEELERKIKNDYSIREVAARIDLIEMRPIPNLVEQYINHKITRAGGNPEQIFQPDAYESLRRLLPRANPLMINNLVSQAIIQAWKADQFPITGEVVEESYKQIVGI